VGCNPPASRPTRQRNRHGSLGGVRPVLREPAARGRDDPRRRAARARRVLADGRPRVRRRADGRGAGGERLDRPSGRGRPCHAGRLSGGCRGRAADERIDRRLSDALGHGCLGEAERGAQHGPLRVLALRPIDARRGRPRIPGRSTVVRPDRLVQPREARTVGRGKPRWRPPRPAAPAWSRTP